MITVKIADLAIGIDNRYSYISEYAKDYLTEEKPLFTVKVTDEDIEAERAESPEEFSDAYYESIAAYRKIAEILPSYDAFLFHGAVIELDNKAYIITANSGVGKTTHLKLWLSRFGEEVGILNGDKPTLRFIDGVPYASGTPWRGKEGYGKSGIKEISGIAFLERGEKNRAYRIEPSEAAVKFVSQTYLPKKDKLMLIKTLNLSNKLINSVRLVRLECNMELEAAEVSRKALTE
jgi:hypothetical protein